MDGIGRGPLPRPHKSSSAPEGAAGDSGTAVGSAARGPGGASAEE